MGFDDCNLAIKWLARGVHLVQRRMALRAMEIVPIHLPYCSMASVVVLSMIGSVWVTRMVPFPSVKLSLEKWISKCYWIDSVPFLDVVVVMMVVVDLRNV